MEKDQIKTVRVLIDDCYYSTERINLANELARMVSTDSIHVDMTVTDGDGFGPPSGVNLKEFNLTLQISGLSQIDPLYDFRDKRKESEVFKSLKADVVKAAEKIKSPREIILKELETLSVNWLEGSNKKLGKELKKINLELAINPSDEVMLLTAKKKKIVAVAHVFRHNGVILMEGGYTFGKYLSTVYGIGPKILSAVTEHFPTKFYSIANNKYLNDYQQAGFSIVPQEDITEYLAAELEKKKAKDKKKEFVLMCKT